MSDLLSDDTVRLVTTGSYDHDWDIRGAAQLAGDVEAVPSWQTEIEHYEIRT